MARKIGINQLTPVEAQGHSKERQAAQMVGYLPGVWKLDPQTGKGYMAYPRDPTHPRWQKSEPAKSRTPRRTKTETFDLDDLDLAA